MTLARQTERCPYCKEQVAVGATKCRYCQSELSSSKSAGKRLKKLDTFRFGFICGLLFTFALVLLGYLHFSSTP